MSNYLTPNWPAPSVVRAVVTTRAGGYSKSPYNSLNLGTNTGDDPLTVARNRQFLIQDLALPDTPYWLQQQHSNRIINLATACDFRADASFTRQRNQICTILTADCLPILLCDRAGTLVAAIHAGWRSLAQQIIARTVTILPTDPQHLLAWLGPAISASYFIVQQDVYDIFQKALPGCLHAFTALTPQKYQADLYQIATHALKLAGVSAIYCDNYCTYTQADKFFSYRRDQGTTGRIASLIWLTN